MTTTHDYRATLHNILSWHMFTQTRTYAHTHTHLATWLSIKVMRYRLQWGLY